MQNSPNDSEKNSISRELAEKIVEGDFDCQFCDIVSDKKDAAWEGIDSLPPEAIYTICCKCLSEMIDE